MANVRVIVEDDNGRIVADYPLDNGDLAEVLEAAADLRRSHYELTGIELEPNIRPEGGEAAYVCDRCRASFPTEKGYYDHLCPFDNA